MNPLARYLDPAVIQQVSRLDLRARFIVEGFLAGLHSSPFHGFSVEFSEHRKYVQGDEPRTIDWRVFARTDRLFVRKYAAETHLACHLLVDTSASMAPLGSQAGAATTADATAASTSKLSYAIHLAAALGYLVTRQQDEIGLGLIGPDLTEWLPARGRRAHLIELLARLARARARGKTDLGRSVAAALAQIPHRGLVVLLSDLLSDVATTVETLHRVRFRGHDLIVFHILDAEEARFPYEGSVRLEDPETGAQLTVDATAVRARYLAAVQRWRAELAHQCAAARVDYVPLDTAQPFDRALLEFLGRRRRRR